MPVLICNLRKTSPSHPYDVIVDRTSVLGCPFRVRAFQTREQVCSNYAHLFSLKLKTPNSKFVLELERIKQLYIEHGIVRLFCWYTPEKCHAETIKTWLERNVK